MTDGMFCAQCLSQYQEILSKTRLFGTRNCSKLGRSLYMLRSLRINSRRNGKGSIALSNVRYRYKILNTVSSLSMIVIGQLKTLNSLTFPIRKT